MPKIIPQEDDEARTRTAASKVKGREEERMHASYSYIVQDPKQEIMLNPQQARSPPHTSNNLIKIVPHECAHRPL